MVNRNRQEVPGEVCVQILSGLSQFLMLVPLYTALAEVCFSTTCHHQALLEVTRRQLKMGKGDFCDQISSLASKRPGCLCPGRYTSSGAGGGAGSVRPQGTREWRRERMFPFSPSAPSHPSVPFFAPSARRGGLPSPHHSGQSIEFHHDFVPRRGRSRRGALITDRDRERRAQRASSLVGRWQ